MATFTVTTSLDQEDDIDGFGTISIANFGGLNDISLREAVLLANNAAGADDIDFDASLSTGPLFLTLGHIPVTEDLAINGDTDGDGEADITVSGNDTTHFFSLLAPSQTLTLESLTLTNGFNSADGGAIDADVDGTVRLLNSTIRDSVSFDSGGAIFATYVYAANSTFSGNRAGNFGGAVSFYGAGEFTNVTIHDNYAASFGGGLFSNIANLTLQNSTVTENESSVDGGAIGAFTGSLLTIRNSVLADNVNGTGGDIIFELSGPVTIVGGNSFFDASAADVDIDTDEGGNTTTSGADPGLGPLADNGGVVQTRAIQDGSPLLEAALSTLPTEADIGFDVDGDGTVETTAIGVDARGAGFLRDVDINGTPPTPDIGAFEQQLAGAFIVTTKADEAFDGGTLADEQTDGDGLSLREALGLANLDPTTADTITFADGPGEAFDGFFPSIALALGEMSIAGPVDIVGNGDIRITAQGNSRIFNIDDGDNLSESAVSLTGVRLISGEAALGGAIINREDLTLTDAEINSSRASVDGANAYGGGIFNHGSGDLTINNSLLANNGAIATGTNVSAYGAAIFHASSGVLSISGSESRYNYARAVETDGKAYGGVIAANNGTVLIDDSVFRDNDAQSQAGSLGGAIFGNSPPITITSSVFRDNQATSDGAASKSYGGALAITGGLLTVTDSTIRDNLSSGDDIGYGGGVFAYGGDGFEITRSTISGNTAAGVLEGGLGGGLHSRLSDLSVTASITNSTVSGNEASLFGGGLVNAGGTLAINNSTIAGNDYIGLASGEGPATTNTTITSSIVADNEGGDVLYSGLVNSIASGGNNLIGNADFAIGAFVDGVNGDIVGGGGTEVDPVLGPLQDNGGPTETHALLSGSPALDAGANPESLTTDQRGAERVVDSGSGTATPDIGAFEAQSTAAGPLVVTTLSDEAYDGGLLADEMADGDGLSLREAIGLANIDTTIPDTILFAGDVADVSGLTLLAADGVTDVTGVGGTINLAAALDDMKITSSLAIDGDLNDDGIGDVTVDADSADGAGDADSRIFTMDGTATVSGSTVIGNPIAVEIDGLTLRNGDALDENRGEGGAILLEQADQLTVRNSVFEFNSAVTEGGAISGERLSQISVSDSAFSANQAGTAGGGAIEMEDGGVLTVVGSTFDGNMADNDGGAIFHDGNTGDLAFPGVLTIVDSVFTNNSAIGNFAFGGAFEAEDRTVVNVINSVFDGNYAQREGGAIYHDGGSSSQSGVLNIFNSSITNNGSGHFGGGISTSSRVDVAIVNTTVANNVSPEDGGGIYLDNHSNNYIVNSTVTGNVGRDGGGIYVGNYGANTSLTLTNSIVAGNKALYAADDVGAANASATLTGDGFNILGSAPVGFGETLGANGLVLGDGNPFTLADIFDTVVMRNPDGLPGTGDEFDAGEVADNGGPNGDSSLLNSAGTNPALDAGSDTASLGITIDESVLGFDVNGDGDATDIIDDIGDFLFDQRGTGFDRLIDQPGVANNGANTIDLGALERVADTPPIIELALIDTDTDQLITIIRDGDDVPLSLVQGRNVTLSATVPNTSPLFGQVESMFLNFNGGEATRGETVEPYALFGDDTAGDFFDGTMLELGGQSLVLDLFSDDARNNLLSTVEFTFTVVDGPNASPAITSDDNPAVDENQTFAIDVQSTDDSDSEGSGLTYSLDGGADETAFSIDPVTGVLTFNAAPDFENPTDADTDNVYEVDVLVTDSGNESASQSISITVEDVFEAPNASPAITSDDNPAVDENQTFAIDVQSTDDSDSEGSGLTYSLDGGADETAFSIDPVTGVLTFNSAPDFENPTDANTDNVYEVDVLVTDSGNESTSQSINVTVEDVDETVPPVVELALIDTDTDTVLTIVEDGDDVPLSLVQGRNVTLSATVPNTSPLFGQVESMFLNFNSGEATRGETVEPYALFGDDTAGDFFDGTMLDLGGQSLVLDLFSDNGRNNLLETVEINFTVTDGPNASPVITSDNGNAVDENQTFAIDVQSTDDRDSEGSGLTYSLDGGADETAFSIDPVTGVLTFNSAPDFENPTDADTDNVYEVDVLVTDSGNESASQSITITVEDVDETVQSLAEVGIYDTDTNALVTLIEDGDVFPVGLFNGNEDDLTIGVVIPNSSPLFGQVESVFLDLNDGQVTRTENAELYTLNGDFNGDLFDGQDLTGDNTIALEFYSNNQRGGDLLGTLELDFSIDDSPLLGG